MDNSLQLGLWFLGLWTASVGIAFLLTKRRRVDPIFLPNAFWKLQTPQGTMRARFVGESRQGYRIEAPMAKGSFVPLRPGDAVYVEAPGIGSAMTFKTQIVGRDTQDHTLTLRLVANPITHNRRDDARLKGEETIMVNGVPSQLVDLSSSGAKVVTVADLAPGDLVRLARKGDESRLGWVLEVLPDTLDGRLASRVRLIFAEPTS